MSASSSLNFTSCWPRGLTSGGRKVSTRSHSNDSIELEVRSATRALGAPQTPETIGKEGSYGVGWGDAPDLKGKLGYSSRMEVRKSRSGIQKISEGVSQSYYVQQPVFKEICNNPIQARLIVAQTIQE